jgi:hypothetical protein
VRTYFKNGQGGQETTFGQDAIFEGEELAKARETSVMHEVLELRRLYTDVNVAGFSKLGADTVFHVRLTPKIGKQTVLHVSARTGLIVRREGGAQVTVYEDFRRVDGEVVPFRTNVEGTLGLVSTEIKQVRFGVEFSAETFARITGLR